MYANVPLHGNVKHTPYDRGWARSPGPGTGPGLVREVTARTFNFLVLFARTSSVHGLLHVSTASRRHPLERALWLCCVVLCVWGATWVSLKTWHHYQQSPTVISMERDYKAWNTSFPSVTICLDKKTDPERVAAVAQRLNSEYNIGDEKSVVAFLEALTEVTYANMGSIPKLTAIPASRFLELVLEVDLQWNASVNSLNSDSADFSPYLTPTVTERGVCYSFNTLMAAYFSPKYWREGARALSGPRGVLQVNPLDGDVFAQLVRLPGGYSVYVHGPGEVPDVVSVPSVSVADYFKTLEVSALAVHTTDAARGLPPEQRGCRFMDEPEGGAEAKLPVYSYNVCRRECRARLAVQLCGCVPHFYGPPGGKDAPVTCDVAGLHCLGKQKDHLIRLQQPFSQQRVQCSCLPTCDDVQFIIDTDNNVQWFLGTDFKWGLSKYPRMRLKRDIIFGLTDVMVSVGSSAGLFLGCSVLSFIEVIYFFTLRLFWYMSARSGRTSTPKLRSRRLESGHMAYRAQLILLQ